VRSDQSEQFTAIPSFQTKPPDFFLSGLLADPSTTSDRSFKLSSFYELAMKNRFLVLIDFSPYSEQLLRFVHEWSKRVNADILLIHSTDVLMPLMAPSESRQEIVKMANRDALKKMLELTKAVFPEGAPFTSFVSEEDLTITLRRFLLQKHNNLVFLGLKGTGLLKRIFMGSRSVKIIEDIDNLIVAMPKHAVCCAPESIHVAVQKSCPLNMIELNNLLKLAGEEIKKINFFSVLRDYDDTSMAERYLNEIAVLYSGKTETSYELYRERDTLVNLKNAIFEKKNEFIVVQKSSPFFLDPVFKKFLINELVYEGNNPLIILP